MNQKLNRIRHDNDHDDDGFVTTSDFRYDMGNNYDTDGMLSYAEYSEGGKGGGEGRGEGWGGEGGGRGLKREKGLKERRRE